MNITILANRDVAACYALNLLLPALSGHRLTIFLSTRVGSRRALPAALQELKFFEQDLFNLLLFPALDAGAKCDGAELKTFNGIGRAVGNPVSELDGINSERGLQRLRGSQPDLLLSIRYGTILQEAAIRCPRYGVLNLHSGLLPDYRGVMATFRAMLNGESHAGATVHYIEDATIDTGRVVATTRLEIDARRSYLAHVLALYDEGCRLLAEAVGQIARTGKAAAIPRSSPGNYHGFPDEAELAEFARRGFTLTNASEMTAIAAGFLPPT